MASTQADLGKLRGQVVAAELLGDMVRARACEELPSLEADAA
jgi:hypothetical protein